MTHQCKLCLKWFHYPYDNPVCRDCYNDYKQFEIYDRQSKFTWGEEE